MFLLPIMVVLFACGGMRQSDIRSFIPGMYVRPIEHEFASGSDTLVIRHLQDNTYEIIKRSSMMPIRNGKSLPLKHDRETWIGLYDEPDGVIYEQRKGKIISFVPKESKLLIGASAYQKVK